MITLAAIHHPWDGCPKASLVTTSAAPVFAYLACEACAFRKTTAESSWIFAGVVAGLGLVRASNKAVDAIHIASCALRGDCLQRPASVTSVIHQSHHLDPSTSTSSSGRCCIGTGGEGTRRRMLEGQNTRIDSAIAVVLVWSGDNVGR